MKLTTTSFENGGPIPERCAFGKPHPGDHVQFAGNRNPQLAWVDLPAGTRSLALICHDTECPASPTNVNREGITVPVDLPRTNFYHWVLLDIAPDSSPIEEGEFSDGVTQGGKDQPGPRHTRQGLNNYTDWFSADPDMVGKYFGYDGPGPPWNDELVHRYHFTLYALDIEQCPIKGDFQAPDVLEAIDGHILMRASIVGTYAINPDAVARP